MLFGPYVRVDLIRSERPDSGDFRVFHDMHHRGTYRTCQLIPFLHHELGKRRELSIYMREKTKAPSFVRTGSRIRFGPISGCRPFQSPEHVPTASNDHVVGGRTVENKAS
jgi:hypothetical protein